MKLSVNTIRVCIDSLKEDCDFSGRICSIGLQETEHFANYGLLMLKIDHALDAIGKPQATHIPRKFSEEKQTVSPAYRGTPEIYHSAEEVQNRRGLLYTADICVESRLRNTWQGVLTEEDGTEHIFRSDLELGKQLLAILQKYLPENRAEK